MLFRWAGDSCRRLVHCRRTPRLPRCRPDRRPAASWREPSPTRPPTCLLLVSPARVRTGAALSSSPACAINFRAAAPPPALPPQVRPVTPCQRLASLPTTHRKNASLSSWDGTPVPSFRRIAMAPPASLKVLLPSSDPCSRRRVCSKSRPWRRPRPRPRTAHRTGATEPRRPAPPGLPSLVRDLPSRAP